MSTTVHKTASCLCYHALKLALPFIAVLNKIQYKPLQPVLYHIGTRGVVSKLRISWYVTTIGKATPIRRLGYNNWVQVRRVGGAQNYNRNQFSAVPCLANLAGIKES